jgi:SHS2 domain-containing protein
MAQRNAAGFREIAHTADWELEVWAPDLAGLFEQAARGMYALMGIQPLEEKRISRQLAISAADPESLLVAFLSELLYQTESEGLFFDSYGIALEGYHLEAQVAGAPISSQSKQIKAVTYHNLEIRESGGRLEANIVFDV